MINFFVTLKLRNETMFYYGLVCLFSAFIFLGLARFSNVQVNQVNAWYKPFKFAFSTFLFAWTMAWYCHYLPNFNIRIFNWTVILLLGFEITYIAIQAGRGQLSHFNLSSPTYAAFFSAMAIAATVVTLYTAYVGVLFCVNEFPTLPHYYVWAIRLSIFIFVIFSFEGFLMGSRLAHTVGGPDGSAGIPILNWSMTLGDLRVAHFIGMHALQVLPILSFYLFKSSRVTIIVSSLYAILAIVTCLQALQGKPIFTNHQKQNEIIH